MNLLSIIIPAYNSEKTILKCLESVQTQSYEDLEIIIINDGSTDRTGTICDKVALTDSRIKVLHQENCGVSHSRNAGIGMAKGEYIGFVDSDDIIDPDMYKDLYYQLMEDNSSIGICGYYTEIDGLVTPVVTTSYPASFNSHQALCYLYQESFIEGFLCNKLYHRTLLENFPIPEDLSVCEDLYMNTIILCNHDITVSYVARPFYHYIKNENSQTSSQNFFNTQGEFRYLPAFCKLNSQLDIKKLLSQGIDIPYKYASILQYSMFVLLQNYSANTLQIKKLKHHMRILNRYILLSKTMAPKEKLHFFILELIPVLYKKYKLKD